MRILEFDVVKQRLKKRPGCDFTGLVAGSVGYLHAKFHFLENDWNSCTDKIARFWMNDEEHAFRLDKGNVCEIPSEVLTNTMFQVSVIGVAPGYKIETNKITVRQGVH